MNINAEPQQGPPAKSLLDLPTELRFEIYRHFFDSTKPQFAEKAGRLAILPPLLVTCPLTRGEAMKLYFAQVRRNVNDCAAKRQAHHRTRPGPLAPQLEQDAWDEQDDALFEDLSKAWRIHDSAEDMLLKMAFPVAKWLKCGLDAKW